MLSLDDTIAAIASASGGAARGIVRLSGPQAVDVITRCFKPAPSIDLGALKRATAVTGSIRRGQAIHGPSWDQFELPADLLIWPTNRSYTRQPMAEIHTIGSPPLLEAVLDTVCNAGARLAQPGEFTLRAFLAGRIDLMQAEAVLGVIDAADRRQLETALDQLAGGLSQPLRNLRNDLIDLLADLEAGLDFVEDDIRFVAPAELQSRLTAAAAQLEQSARQLSIRGVSSGKPRVVLMGRPNVGKSSLFNALVRDSAALVSPQPGTTRDYLTAIIDADGLSIELIDTAGIATTSDSIDAAAQQIASEQNVQADLRLLCVDIAADHHKSQRDDAQSADTIIVLTKCDLQNDASPNQSAIDGVKIIATSSRTGLGLDHLTAAIRAALTKPTGGAEASGVIGTSARVRDSIRLANESVSTARQLAANQAGEELVAVELRIALTELGKILGVIYTEDLLDRIFSRFCIGK